MKRPTAEEIRNAAGKPVPDVIAPGLAEWYRRVWEESECAFMR